MQMVDYAEHGHAPLAYPHELAPYASDATASRGRYHPEPPSAVRTAFQRDRDRIIHCAAFRRLTYKTQVFVYHEGDHYRTRLTHSLEVAQIARTLARTLRLDEDLAETIALAHDLGHTPFGHAGEDALNAAMAEFGGFDHNAQSLRIVTLLESRYAAFDGLNLSWETLEGLVKHNGPLLPPGQADVATADLPHAIAVYCSAHDLELESHAAAEAQFAALADDIAYNNHDIDDGLRAGLITLDRVGEVPLVGRLIEAVRRDHPALAADRLIYEVNRRLITVMIFDLLEETRRRLSELAPRSAEDIRRAGAPVAGFSEAMLSEISALRGFLHAELYCHPRIAETMARAKTVLADLFAHYMDHPEDLDPGWRELAIDAAPRDRARCVCDFIAGMTDRFALHMHGRLFDGPADLR
ncbi:MAG: deoxyguanosinetriphosphate triphosphohydrolase [Dichotomicrobium sp.]